MRSSPHRLPWAAAGSLRGTMLSALLLVAIASPSAAAQQASLRESINRALVKPDGRRMVEYRWAREPHIVALYFGADWCGPCHVLVPEIKRIRQVMLDAGVQTEVVYVSLDESERAMRHTMREQAMPWPAIDYRRLPALPRLRELGGPAPPNLVLIDRDGRVLSNGWQGRRYSGVKPVLRAWLEASHTSRHLPD